MTDTVAFLKNLISLPGLSGFEGPLRQVVRDAWQPLVDELDVSRLGSLQALRRGSAAQPRPSMLFAAHMDAIGMMVTGLVDGLLHITEIGGLDPRVLPGQLVTVHGRRPLSGVIAQPGANLLPPGSGGKPVALEYLLVDVGLPQEQLKQLVRVGDLVSFAQPPLEMNGDLLAGHSLDNRASVAALTVCLQELQGRQSAWDIWAVATAQEEETLGGALTSAYALRPSLAVAIDVTFAASPGSPAHRTFPLGKGITLGWGPNVHSALHRTFKALAERLEIPYKLEPLPRHSGTDAHAMQIVAHGIPTMVISIPLRYMHTPVEMVSLKDINRAGRLLAEFAATLEADYLERLDWDDPVTGEA